MRQSSKPAGGSASRPCTPALTSSPATSSVTRCSSEASLQSCSYQEVQEETGLQVEPLCEPALRVEALSARRLLAMPEERAEAQ